MYKINVLHFKPEKAVSKQGKAFSHTHFKTKIETIIIEGKDNFS